MRRHRLQRMPEVYPLLYFSPRDTPSSGFGGDLRKGLSMDSQKNMILGGQAMIEALFRRYPLARDLHRGVVSRIFSLTDKEGVRVMERDWDSLVVLDACRFDTFEKVNWIEGRLSKRSSLGSNTREWVRRNFREEYSDTVFISGNPQISRVNLNDLLGGNPFFLVEEVWDYGWDKEIQSVPPNRVTEVAIERKGEHPDKRFIIHYLQPHCPFLPCSGLTREDLSSMGMDNADGGFLWEVMRVLSHRYEGVRIAMKNRAKRTGNVWDYLSQGRVDVARAKEAYEENLKFVLNEAEELVKELEGKVVITSDHGNLFGEHFMYGHPCGVRFKELIEVPWLEVGAD